MTLKLFHSGGGAGQGHAHLQREYHQEEQGKPYTLRPNPQPLTPTPPKQTPPPTPQTPTPKPLNPTPYTQGSGLVLDGYAGGVFSWNTMSHNACAGVYTLDPAPWTLNPEP